MKMIGKKIPYVSTDKTGISFDTQIPSLQKYDLSSGNNKFDLKKIFNRQRILILAQVVIFYLLISAFCGNLLTKGHQSHSSSYSASERSLVQVNRTCFYRNSVNIKMSSVNPSNETLPTGEFFAGLQSAGKVSSPQGDTELFRVEPNQAFPSHQGTTGEIFAGPQSAGIFSSRQGDKEMFRVEPTQPLLSHQGASGEFPAGLKLAGKDPSLQGGKELFRVESYQSSPRRQGTIGEFFAGPQSAVKVSSLQGDKGIFRGEPTQTLLTHQVSTGEFPAGIESTGKDSSLHRGQVSRLQGDEAFARAEPNPPFPLHQGSRGDHSLGLKSADSSPNPQGESESSLRLATPSRTSTGFATNVHASVDQQMEDMTLQTKTSGNSENRQATERRQTSRVTIASVSKPIDIPMPTPLPSPSWNGVSNAHGGGRHTASSVKGFPVPQGGVHLHAGTELPTQGSQFTANMINFGAQYMTQPTITQEFHATASGVPDHSPPHPFLQPTAMPSTSSTTDAKATPKRNIQSTVTSGSLGKIKARNGNIYEHLASPAAGGSGGLVAESPPRQPAQKTARKTANQDEMDDDEFVAQAQHVEESALLANALSKFAFSSTQLRKLVTESILSVLPCPILPSQEQAAAIAIAELVLDHLGRVRRTSRKSTFAVQNVRGISARNLNKLGDWATERSTPGDIQRRMTKIWISMCDDEVDILDRYPQFREAWFMDLSDQVTKDGDFPVGKGNASPATQVPPRGVVGPTLESYSDRAALFRPSDEIVTAAFILLSGMARSDAGHAGTFKTQTALDVLAHIGVTPRGDIAEILRNSANWSRTTAPNDRQHLSIPLEHPCRFSENEAPGSFPRYSGVWSKLNRSVLTKTGNETPLGCIFICAQPWIGPAKVTFDEHPLVLIFRPLAHEEAVLKIQVGVIRAAVSRALETIGSDAVTYLVPCPINFFAQPANEWHSSLGLQVYIDKDTANFNLPATIDSLRGGLGMRQHYSLFQVELGGMEYDIAISAGDFTSKPWFRTLSEG